VVPASPVAAGGLVLATQQRIEQLLHTATRTDDPDQRQRIRAVLDELHTLAYRSLRALHDPASGPPAPANTIVQECGRTTPAARDPLDSYDAHTIAVATTIAHLAHQDDPTGQALLDWIIAADRRRLRPAEPGRILKPWRWQMLPWSLAATSRSAR
jgi:hypothetical protein